MRSLRTTTIALATAGALALSVAPAMAQDSSVSSEDGQSSLSSTSSTVGNTLEATDQERALFGSSKDFDEASDFGKAWYGYTIAATVAAVAGGVVAAYPAIQDIAAQNGIQLPSLAF